eukprot:3661716-Prymnesium_polylepis.1
MRGAHAWSSCVELRRRGLDSAALAPLGGANGARGADLERLAQPAHGELSHFTELGPRGLDFGQRLVRGRVDAVEGGEQQRP